MRIRRLPCFSSDGRMTIARQLFGWTTCIVNGDEGKSPVRSISSVLFVVLLLLICATNSFQLIVEISVLCFFAEICRDMSAASSSESRIAEKSYLR